MAGKKGQRKKPAGNLDPVTRLIAAITLRAVRDYITLYDEVTDDDYWSAYQFCWSQPGKDLIAYFTDMSLRQVHETLMEIERPRIHNRVNAA